MGLRNILAPRQQVQNSQGEPVAAGFVELYEPGTTTFIQAFQDSGLTVPHTQPIRLSGSGRANIWISLDCDLRITDRNGQLILTEDNANPDGLGASESGNLISNGSFEDDTNADGTPDSWDLTSFTNSNNARDTTESTEGGASFRFTGTDANGGGELQTTNFFPVNDADDLRVNFDIRSTVVNVQNICVVEWYDVSQVPISDSTIYDSTANPLTFTSQQLSVTPPANARFAKIEFTGIAAAGPVTIGSTYIDRVQAFYPAVVSGIFDNIEIRNNEIITTNTNGDLDFNPNGTGAVNIGNNGAVDLTDAKNSANIGSQLPASNRHLAFSDRAIQGKTNGTSVAAIEINTLGGGITIGAAGVTAVIQGGLNVAESSQYSSTLGVTGALTATGQIFHGNNYTQTSINPRLVMVESDAAANNGRWDFAVQAEEFIGRVIDDADSGSANWLRVNRTLNVIDSIEFPTFVTIETANNGRITFQSAITEVRTEGSLYLGEKTAGTNHAAFGQIYVNASQQLIFRTDAGAETVLGSGAPAGTQGAVQFYDSAAFGGVAAQFAFNTGNTTGNMVAMLDPNTTTGHTLQIQAQAATFSGQALSLEQTNASATGDALDIFMAQDTGHAINFSGSQNNNWIAAQDVRSFLPVGGGMQMAGNGGGNRRYAIEPEFGRLMLSENWTSDTTFSTVSDLTITTESSQYYEVNICLRFGSGVNGKVKLNAASGSHTLHCVATVMDNAGVAQSPIFISGTGDSQTLTFTNDSNDDALIIIRGFLFSFTGADIIIQAAQNTSQPVQLRMEIGSWFLVNKHLGIAV
ncbi:MAG: hypothetical protein ACR2PR_08010 [Pseudohongiellaceae bacterium]